ATFAPLDDDRRWQWYSLTTSAGPSASWAPGGSTCWRASPGSGSSTTSTSSRRRRSPGSRPVPAPRPPASSCRGRCGGSAGARPGLIATRTNALSSIPVMYFTVATSHFAAVSDHLKILPSNSSKAAWYVVAGVLTLLIEANALGLVGGVGPGPARKPLESHK